MRLRILREVSQSDLARLWQNPVFGQPKRRWLTNVNARFGGAFTIGAIALAAAGAVAWWPDLGASVSVATAVLIIACPCALTMSAPIALGTAACVLGERGLFLKDPAVALDLSRIDTVAFDKTGTLTSVSTAASLDVHGLPDDEWPLVRALASASSHPMSRVIATAADVRIAGTAVAPPPAAWRPTELVEVAGQGIRGIVDGRLVVIG